MAGGDPAGSLSHVFQVRDPVNVRWSMLYTSYCCCFVTSGLSLCVYVTVTQLLCYYPPTCSLCQKPLSMKDVLIDCAGFNHVRFFFIIIQLTLLKRFLTKLRPIQF